MFIDAWRIAPTGIRVLFVSSVLMGLGFYCLIPYLSLHLSGDLRWSLALTGLLLGTRQVCQQGLSFFGGALCDRIGFKRGMVLGVLLRGIGFVSFGFATDLWEFFLAAAISGMGGALFDPACDASYWSLLPEQGRDKLLALRNISHNLGFAASALIGPLLTTFHFGYLCFFSGALFIGAGIFLFVLLPEIVVKRGESLRQGLGTVLADRSFVLYTFFLIGYYYLYVQMWITVPRFIVDMGGGTELVGLFYGTVAGSIILWQMRVSDYLKDYPHRYSLIGIGSLLMAFALFGLSLSSTAFTVLLVALLFAFGSMIADPVAYEVISHFAEETSLGAYHGFNGYAVAIGGALSSSLGGWLYDVGRARGFVMLPWITCLVVGLCLFAMFLRFNRQRAVLAVLTRESII